MLSWLNKQKNGSGTRTGPEMSEMSRENTLKELQKTGELLLKNICKTLQEILDPWKQNMKK